MAQDQAQPLIVPQSGFLITQFRQNVPFTRPVGLLDNRHPNSWIPVLSNVPAAPPGVQGTGGTMLTVQLPCETPIDRDYRVVTYEELERLLPEGKSGTRVEVGLLPTGEAFAPKTAARGEYLLFPSKSSYILYFTHHYFSRENLSRDSTFLRMLINRLTLPLEKLIEAPRLLALKTTVDEVEQALVNSNVVCLDDLGGGVRGVRRIDRFPAEDTWAPYISPEGTLTSRFVAPELFPAPSPSEQEEGKSSSTVTEAITSDPPVDSFPLSVNVKDFAHTTPVSSPANATGAAVPVSGNVAAGQTVVSAPTPQSGRLSSTSVSSAVSLDRAVGQGWPVQPSSTLIGPNGYGLTTGQPNAAAVYQTGFSNTPNYGHPMQNSALSSSDNVSIHALQMRPATCLPQYIFNQGNHSAPTMYAAGAPMSLTMPCSATGGQQFAHVVSSPFANAVLAGHHTPLSGFNPNQTHAAWAAAYMAMLQQQQQQANYMHPSMPPNLHASANTITPAGQSAFPFCYAAQPFSLPTQFSRHPTAQRLPQTPVYPFQTAYAYPSPHAVLQAPMQQPTDVPNHLNKIGGVDTGPTFAPITTSPQGPNNLTYPFLLPQQLQQANSSPPTSNAVAGLAAAAAGLYIQRPAPARTGSTSASVPSTSPSPSLTATSTSKFSTVPSVSSADAATDDQSSQLFKSHTGEDVKTVHFDPCVTASPETPGACAPLVTEKSSCDTSDVIGSAEESTVSQSSTTHLAPCTDDKPSHFNSADDSEDSASSGIGEMNSACSSSTSDAHTTNSSSTLTEQVVGSTHYPHVGRRQYSHPNRFKDASSKT